MKGRVLVIDGEAEVRRKLSAGLTREGCSVVACPDALSAIRELGRGGFDGLITAVFLPDIDGLKVAKVVRALHPNLPILVISEFGDDALRQAALAVPNTAYLHKPLKIADLVKAFGKLPPGTTAPTPAPSAEEPAGRGPARAYLMLRIARHEPSLALFNRLRGTDGVQSCDAVVGDVDIILLAQAPSPEDLRAFADKIRAIPGVEVVSVSSVEPPKLDPEVRPFAEAYRREAGPAAQGENASYLVVETDRNLIQRVFATILFTDDVVSCDVTEGGAKIIGRIAADSAGRARKTLDRLSRMDGVLRVREAKIIRMLDK